VPRRARSLGSVPYSNAYKLRRSLYRTASPFQRIQVVESVSLGHILVIDNDLMLNEVDEFHYHEMMAHVPLAYLPKASRALVIGGGDGGTLQQVLQHPNIANATLVDIDRKVVETCKRYFPLTSVAFSNARAKVVFADGSKWARARCDDPAWEPVDVIVIDSTDFNAAVPLFEVGFYRALKECVLRPGGILVHNLDSLCWDIGTVRMRSARMRSVFKHVHIYQVHQPTYSGGHYSVNFASDAIDPFAAPIDWKAFEDKKMFLRYYNPDIHYAAFALPSFVLNQLKTMPRNRLEAMPSRPPARLATADDIYSLRPGGAMHDDFLEGRRAREALHKELNGTAMPPVRT
jgi:spermidine synthase